VTQNLNKQRASFLQFKVWKHINRRTTLTLVQIILLTLLLTLDSYTHQHIDIEAW